MTTPLLTLNIPLPTNMSHGLVTARYGIADDAHDFTPPTNMIVTITPSVQVLIDPTADPDPVILALSPVICSINADGYLCGVNGNPGVLLIATDDDSVQPVGWTYSARFRVDEVKVYPSFSFQVPGGAVIDLVTVTPINSSAGFPAWDATRETAFTVGDGIHSTFALAHNLGTRDVKVEVVEIATGQTAYPVVQRTTALTLYVDFGDTIPGADSYRVLVQKVG